MARWNVHAKMVAVSATVPVTPVCVALTVRVLTTSALATLDIVVAIVVLQMTVLAWSLRATVGLATVRRLDRSHTGNHAPSRATPAIQLPMVPRNRHAVQEN